MNSIKKLLGITTVALVLLAGVLSTASTVSAELATPLISFYQSGEEVKQRRMTPSEHTALMKLQLAMGALNPEQSAQALTDSSIELAVRSLESAFEGVKVTQSASGEATSVDIDLSIESIADAVAKGGEEIGRYAERVGTAAENLESEIKKHSSDIPFDHVAIGEGEERFELTFDQD